MMRKVLGVKREYIDIPLKTIKDIYRDYKTYFEKEYGLDKNTFEKIKNYYLN